MSIVDECYKKSYQITNEPFNVDAAYFPLIVRHDTFASLDEHDILDDRLSVYCSYHLVTKKDISNAKNKILKQLHPLTQIKINYCFMLYYSEYLSKSIRDIETELDYLKNMGHDINFSNDYLTSVIVVIDSTVKKDNRDLIDFLQNIKNTITNNEKLDICIFNYDKNVPANFEILMDSIIASIVYRCHSESKDKFSTNRSKAHDKINKYTQSLPQDRIKDVPLLQWQSVCASFSNKKRDFIACTIGKFINSNLIKKLSVDIVEREISNISASSGSSAALNGLLIDAVKSIPLVKDRIKYSNTYSFRDICEEMFGDEGYIVCEISCKTTLTEYKKKLIPTYIGDIDKLLLKLSEYYHENLISYIISGINQYIDQLKKEIEAAETDYAKFLRKLFEKDENPFDDVLVGYVTRFLKREELKAASIYWEVIKIEVNKEYTRAKAKEFEKIANEFREIKNQFSSYRSGYNFGDISLDDFPALSIVDIPKLSENEEFINQLKNLYETYSQQAENVAYEPQWGHILAYDPQSAVSEKFDITADYGDYQLRGKQLFAKYWSFK